MRTAQTHFHNSQQTLFWCSFQQCLRAEGQRLAPHVQHRCWTTKARTISTLTPKLSLPSTCLTLMQCVCLFYACVHAPTKWLGSPGVVWCLLTDVRQSRLTGKTLPVIIKSRVIDSTLSVVLERAGRDRCWETVQYVEKDFDIKWAYMVHNKDEKIYKLQQRIIITLNKEIALFVLFWL